MANLAWQRRFDGMVLWFFAVMFEGAVLAIKLVRRKTVNAERSHS